ncbi:MAG: L-serine ammonia-lyase [Marichromatium sp.]|nr:L-serine ammonia-lyase [Marichromatium sp.]
MQSELFEIYKIGIGPSSSHTFGPMVAAHRFLSLLDSDDYLKNTTTIYVELCGSLGATGKGHLSDVAVVLGLLGYKPESVPTEKIKSIFDDYSKHKMLKIGKNAQYVKLYIKFIEKPLAAHENGIRFIAKTTKEVLIRKNYYSIGGGFIEEDIVAQTSSSPRSLPYPFENAKALLAHTQDASLQKILLENSAVFHSHSAIFHHVNLLWEVMQEGIQKGLTHTGNLPAPTRLARRAHALHQGLESSDTSLPAFMHQMSWVNLFAIALSEENASGGRVVTAPTNGACGIVPAVLMYYHRFVEALDEEGLLRFFLVSAAIGGLFKRNASISGAEVGCQGEVGVASSMAAAGLAELMGATPAQVMIAAEIAMEHHLGLTCDPLNGQVQVPCVERNGVAAVTAIDAAAMALSRTHNQARVSLDEVIEAMRQTGKDMHPKYRETSCGGLAVVAKR